MDTSEADEQQETQEFQRLQAKYAQVKRRNISLQQRVEELEAQVSSQGGELKKLSSASHQVKELQRQNQVLRLNLAASEKTAARASEANRGLSHRVEQMESSYRERLNEIQTLLTKLEEVNGVVRELQATREDTDDVVQRLNAKYQKKCKALDFAEKCLKKAQAFKLHKELRMTILHHAAEMERMQKLVAHQQAERNALISQLKRQRPGEDIVASKRPF
eukprot:INCI16033.2.p1 GENE.INCI16033.2~~INCI16033.2.p1  ORF type:complete len:219 (+),score=59.32 INCI16033.2:269-925(+)